MSAVSVAVWSSGVVVAADGVAYDYDTGAIAAHRSKIIVYPARNAIIAWAGIGNFGHALDFTMAGDPATFDELVDIFPALCAATYLRLLAQGMSLEPESKREVSVVLAGYSSRRGAYEAYRIASYAKGSQSAPGGIEQKIVPWTMLPIEYIYCSYSPEPQTAKRFALDRVGEMSDPVEICTRFICAARAESGLNAHGGPDGEPRHFNAGGYIQVAYLQPDHLQSWIAHRWPTDAIGQPIDPSLGDPMPIQLMEKDHGQVGSVAG